MNPLITTDPKTGIFGGIQAKTREEFISNINNFHAHFVINRGWIDISTLSSKPRPNLALRWVTNIIHAIGLKFFNIIPTPDLDRIKNGLSSYLFANADWIAKDKSELSEDLAVKIFQIDQTLGKKARNSFLSRTFKQTFVSPSTWPWIVAVSRIGKVAGLDETGTGMLEVFDKLGWDFKKLNV